MKPCPHSVAICSACLATRERKRAYYLRHRDAISAQRKAALADPVKKAKERDRRARVYAANKSAELERSKKYRHAHKAAIAEQQRSYREANKDRLKEKKKLYVAANYADVKARRDAWREKNKTHIAARLAAKHQQRKPKIRAERQSLGDKYIKKLLSLSSGIPERAIPHELVEVKRTHLKVKRLLKERTK